MPRSRLRLNSPAASAEPVEPPETSAWARPSATALAAWTIEASGVERTAKAGSAALAIEIGASMSSHARGDRADLRRGSEQQHADALGRRAGGAVGYLARTPICSAGINGDRDHASGLA